MRRALAAFGRQGLSIEAAPTLRVRPPEVTLGAMLPRADALASSAFAIHELVGLLYYSSERSPAFREDLPREVDPRRGAGFARADKPSSAPSRRETSGCRGAR
jgi:hypothetical protein